MSASVDVNSVATTFFSNTQAIYLVESASPLSSLDVDRLSWALEATCCSPESIQGTFVGPRREMITPWSTNATDIVANMGVHGVLRIESFRAVAPGEVPVFDPMLEAVYPQLTAESLRIDAKPLPDKLVEDLRAENSREGLALSEEEIAFLENASEQLGRKFTDSEIHGFSQINSEHCRHKIFNGTFVIDGEEQPHSLFQLIKETSKQNPEQLVSAYKDNVAFVRGPRVSQFAPRVRYAEIGAEFFELREIPTVISLKAETHNFPTTVEPFYGASTGSGGEIRDRMAGGTGSIPLVGAAVYMTAYPRLRGGRAAEWERFTEERDWKYQTPAQILIKASNGASDFGNKFGQPVILGSLLTFEMKTSRAFYGFDRVIMLAGGVGFAHERDAQKAVAQKGDVVVLLGGDNYRIGMAGGSVSSVDSGKYSQALELSAVQRANPEMQKRVYNVIRALAESVKNPIKLIHDHGAGGHMNCFSELVEPLGGTFQLSSLPVGDPTLSTKEIVCNESQERMGLIVSPDDVEAMRAIAERERAPFYVVGEITGEKKLQFVKADGNAPVDLPLEVLFGSAPKVVLTDSTTPVETKELEYTIEHGEQLVSAIENVLSLEAVACKDWLTNKVDRSVSGRVALQQTTGPLQLPLNNLGVVALDHEGSAGIATALGHAPVPGIIDEKAGSVLSVVEALTNIVWAPLEQGLHSVVLSANWMWPAKQKGENARLYRAVEAVSQFAIELGIPIPTGKDSLSMTMNYESGNSVRAPGTVIITAAAQCSNIRQCVTPDLKPEQGSKLIHVDLAGGRSFPLGGSSFAQTLAQLGRDVPIVHDVKKFKSGFELLQKLVREERLLAGHDISSGGFISAALEMAFAGDVGIDLSVSGSSEQVVSFLFSEKPGCLLQVKPQEAHVVCQEFQALGLVATIVGEVRGTMVKLHAGDLSFQRSVAELRQTWFLPSYLLDAKQTREKRAKERFESLGQRPLKYVFPAHFSGTKAALGIQTDRKQKSGVRAAIVRDKGTNGDREMAYSLFAAGFDVKDVTVTDLMAGRETLEDIRFVVFPGGFSNSDVLGSARGWAGAIRYNEKADSAIRKFFSRSDTLSLGVCNGCQLMMALELVCPKDEQHPKMTHNDSGKFESIFLNVKVQPTNSILLQPLVGSQLGIWVAHGEGQFVFPENESKYDIPLKYTSSTYPANPNGSQFNAAGLCSADGRHLVMMPHLERSLFSWHWPYKGAQLKREDEFSPWILAFQSAKHWVDTHR